MQIRIERSTEQVRSKYGASTEQVRSKYGASTEQVRSKCIKYMIIKLLQYIFERF